MDDATRARLEHVVSGTWPVLTLARGDVLALLQAHDAIVGDATDLAERLAACQAERDRLRGIVDQAVPLAERLAPMVKKLEAERDRAIPVLAAALAWRGTKSYAAAVHLDQVVATWRAAWEG